MTSVRDKVGRRLRQHKEHNHRKEWNSRGWLNNSDGWNNLAVRRKRDLSNSLALELLVRHNARNASSIRLNVPLRRVQRKPNVRCVQYNSSHAVNASQRHSARNRRRHARNRNHVPLLQRHARNRNRDLRDRLLRSGRR